MKFLRRALPFVVSIVVLGILFWPYREPEARALLWAAVGRAKPWTLPAAACLAVATWLADGYAIARTFQRFGNAISFRETLLVRGATLVFDSVNPSLGQAALVMAMYRRGTPVAVALAIVVLMGVVLMVEFTLISGLGLLAGAAAPGDTSGTTVIVALLLCAGYLAVIGWRPAALARRPGLRGLFDAGLAGHAWAFIYRLPSLAVLVGAQLVYMRCFGINVPLTVAFLYLPAILFVMGLPISVQGLGATQLAQLALFLPYVEGDRAGAQAAVLAWGLGSMLLTNFGLLLVGLACLATGTGRALVQAQSQPATLGPVA